MYDKTKKYRLLKDLPEYPAGTIFICDEDEGRWYPDVDTDINMQYNGSWIIEHNPQWFKPLTFTMDGEEHHLKDFVAKLNQAEFNHNLDSETSNENATTERKGNA